MNRRGRALIVAVSLAVGLGGPGRCLAGESSFRETLDEMVYGEIDRGEGSVFHQVLVRMLPEAHAGQFDVAVGEQVVSFITIWGAGQRARCELVYLHEDAWFGACDVYSFRFGTFREFGDSLLSCDDCKNARRFVVWAGDTGCGPEYVGTGKGSDFRSVFGLQWALELSSWDPTEVDALIEALDLVGSYGCPMFGRRLIEFLGRDEPWYGSLGEGALSPISEIPSSIASLMDHDQLNGFVWLVEHEVDRMPIERSVGIPAESNPAKPGVERAALDAKSWRGVLDKASERLVAEVTVVTFDNLTLMVGSVKNEAGENMAFLVPTSGEGLITSTWAITSLDEKHPSTLWSDGGCLLLEVRTTKEPENFVERAPWLGWGVRTPDVSLLSALQDVEGPSWAVQQLFMGLMDFHPGGVAEAVAFGEVVSKSSKDPAMQPEMLQEYWDEIVYRYFETRDRLRLVDALRVVDAEEPPVEPETGAQPSP